MEFQLERIFEIISRTPVVLNALLRGLPEEWTDRNEGESTWSPYEVVGHLIHGEKTDWIPRTKIILSDSKSKKFEPFDRFAQESQAKRSINELLDEFKNLRLENIEELRALRLSSSDLKKLEFIQNLVRSLYSNLSTWATHDLGHIYQISRVMAKQLKEGVGPWTAYLRILRE